jgi:hypothetical protein
MRREIWPSALAATLMGGGLFLLEHFLVKADQRGTVLGLLLVAGEAVLGLAVYFLLLSLLAPATTRELAAGARRLRARWGGPAT